MATNHNKSQQNRKNSPPYEGGDDCNPRQPDYNRGRLTRDRKLAKITTKDNKPQQNVSPL